MNDEDKSREQLIQEIQILRQEMGVTGIRNGETYENLTERKRIEESLRESNKRFLDVLYASPDAILLIDGEKLVDCNEATARMLGYSSRSDFLMTHPSKLSPPEQPDGRNSFEKANEMMRLAFETGFHRFEWTHTKANGENFQVEVSLTPVVHGGRNILHCLWRDLTERKKEEALLFESNERLESLLNNIDLGIVSVEADYKIKEVNKMLSKDFQRPASAFIGKECFREFKNQDTVCPDCPGKKAMETGSPAEIETERILDDGGEISVRLHAVPLYDKNGLCTGFMELVSNITQRKKEDKDKEKNCGT